MPKLRRCYAFVVVDPFGKAAGPIEWTRNMAHERMWTAKKWSWYQQRGWRVARVRLTEIEEG